MFSYCLIITVHCIGITTAFCLIKCDDHIINSILLSFPACFSEGVGRGLPLSFHSCSSAQNRPDKGGSQHCPEWLILGTGLKSLKLSTQDEMYQEKKRDRKGKRKTTHNIMRCLSIKSCPLQSRKGSAPWLKKKGF